MASEGGAFAMAAVVALGEFHVDGENPGKPAIGHQVPAPSCTTPARPHNQQPRGVQGRPPYSINCSKKAADVVAPPLLRVKSLADAEAPPLARVNGIG